MIKANGVGGQYPPYGIYVKFRVLTGASRVEDFTGHTGSVSNTPSGKIELVFIDNASRRVFFANQVMEWEERLPTRFEFDRDAIFYMPSVEGKHELGDLPGDVQSAVVLDRTLSKEGRIYIWQWEGGTWSQEAIEIIRETNN